MIAKHPRRVFSLERFDFESGGSDDVKKMFGHCFYDDCSVDLAFVRGPDQQHERDRKYRIPHEGSFAQHSVSRLSAQGFDQSRF